MKAILTGFVLVCSLFTVQAQSSRTWTMLTTLPTNGCFHVSMSPDGSTILAAFGTASGGLPIFAYVSTNSGMSWISNEPDFGSLNTAASSWNGKIWISGANEPQPLNYSIDSGYTWQQGLGGSGAGFVACSADGMVMGQYEILSTNGGANFYTPPTPPYAGFTLFPADGNMWISIGQYGMSITTNGGTSWTTNSVPVPGTNLPIFTVSADGSTIAYASGYYNSGTHYVLGNIYISTNFGVSWTKTSAPTNLWTGFACSADGQIIMATAGTYTKNAGGIFISTDGGNNWVSNNVPNTNYYFRATCSADGSKMAAAALRGAVFTSYQAPSPRLNFSGSSNGVALSWILPTTNLVLQENSSLTTSGWTALTNVPALNFINLQEQVTLPTTNSCGFFRLIQN